jgi:hypothetical protein
VDGEAEVMYGILEKHSYWKAMRITAWIARFLFNLRSQPRELRRGVLTTEEIQEQVNWWIKKEQLRYDDTEQLEEDKHRLNLEEKEIRLVGVQGENTG